MEGSRIERVLPLLFMSGREEDVAEAVDQSARHQPEDEEEEKEEQQPNGTDHSCQEHPSNGGGGAAQDTARSESGSSRGRSTSKRYDRDYS